MALYEVVLNLQYNEQKFINRWNYTMTGTPVGVTGSFACVQALGLNVVGSPPNFPVNTMGAAIQAILNEQTIFVQTIVKNIYDPMDFYDYAFLPNTVGGVAGVGLSPVMAIGFNSNRVRTDIRRGQKRFGGVDGDFQGNVGQLSGTATIPCALVAQRMSESPSYTDGGNSLTFEPVIVSKQKTVLPDGTVKYEYYPTESLQAAHLAAGITWFVKTTMRTQGSRQYGRGG